MTETTVIRDDHQVEQPVEAPWEHVECTCPDPCERDHEFD